MSDLSKANDVDCADCAFSKKGSNYQPSHLVCINPIVLTTTGAPRSCADKVRTPLGACRPDGHLFKAKVAATQPG